MCHQTLESATSGYRCESTTNVLTIASKAKRFNCITVKWSLDVQPLADKRAVLLIVDGMADRPLIDHDYKTPLEFANTPNMDRLAKGGLVGQLDPISPGIRAGSDVANLALLGYDPAKYYTGRGALEALGAGIELRPGDVAFRCNFATVDDDFRVEDRRAGRIRREPQNLPRWLMRSRSMAYPASRRFSRPQLIIERSWYYGARSYPEWYRM